MSKREIENLRYALDRVDDVDAKLDYLTNYIMSYGMDGRNDNNIIESDNTIELDKSNEI